MPKFRAKQILDWRNKGITTPSLMRNLPLDLQEKLHAEMVCEPLTLVRKMSSNDGTRKYLFALTRRPYVGKMVEAVFIPDERRGTVCISSQMGCVLDCPFCHTGTQKFEGNINSSEIIAQVLAIKHDLLNDPLPSALSLHGEVSHIVYMGMGEPLANEHSVYQSLEILLSEEGLNLSRRRVTLSTSGLVPQIDRLGLQSPINLAISLHSANDPLRDTLVPINRKYPLQDLRQCLNRYP
ncbi:MAG: 23S rRNA (adenine(2503)-C(2))-methyltransferase RlmN, partial [Zetaproteobacteria bacterium]|nr:23S rRNA (adenine(2503)-C(2))-methyltransferase RlmN [Zetaproteobacteria bacterium]